MSLATLNRFDTHNGDAITDLLINVAMGQVPGAESVYVYGHNPNIPLGTVGMLWPLDNVFGNTGLYQANAVPCYVSSSSASDIAVTLRITVIDINWDRQIIGVTLNGQTPILLPINVRRVASIDNVSATKHIGDIYAGTSPTPTLGVQTLINTMNYSGADEQISHTAFFTVPRGKTLFIYSLSGGTPTNDAMTISGFYSNPETNVFKNGSFLPAFRGSYTQSVNYYKLPEKTDIYLAARAYTNNTEVFSELLGILVDSKYVK